MSNLNRSKICRPILIWAVFLLCIVPETGTAQNHPIFYSDYYPVTPGRFIKIKSRILEPLRLTISDPSIAELQGNSVRGVRRGRAVLYAESENRYLRDSTDIVVTDWISGISTLTISDSLPDFYCTALKNDTIFGVPEIDRVPTNTLVALNKEFLELKKIRTFESVPNWMLHTSVGAIVMVKKADPMTPKKIYRTADYLSWTAVNDTFPTGKGRPPDSYVLFQGWDSDSAGNIYLAEYLSEDSLFPAYPIHLYKSSDNGSSWGTAYTFPPRNVPGPEGGIRHVHTIARDPYQGFLWISTGDNHNQSRIYYHENKLLPDSDGVVRLKQLGNYHEEFKAVSFSFTRDYIYWYMDSPTDTQKIFRIPRMAAYPAITAQNDYRELVGVFRDKAFWQNVKIKIDGQDAFLLETCYEKDYAPMIDRRSRIFVLKEEPELQVQEVFAVKTFGNYSHFYPRGQLSDGSLIFTGLNTLSPGKTLFKARLSWVDVETGEMSKDEPTEFFTVNFPRHSLLLSGKFSGEGKVFALRSRPASIPAPLPDTVLAIPGAMFEFFSDKNLLSEGIVKLKLPGNSPPADSLSWFFYDPMTEHWIDLGCTRRGQFYFNQRPVPTLGVISLVKTGEIPSGLAENKPEAFHLFDIYPNPFNPACTVSFSVNTPTRIAISVFSVLGERIEQLADNIFQQGVHKMNWTPRNGLSAGVYLIEFRTPDKDARFRKTCKAVYTK